MSNRRFSRRDNTPGGLYHVTLHAVARTRSFASDIHKAEYLSRIANYLGPRRQRNSSRHHYASLRDEVRVLAFCVLDNHVHLIVRDLTGLGMTNLMHRVNTGYVTYFNRRHNRRGPLFDARFAAKPIYDDEHARSAIAYVNLNHVSEQLDYRFSSHGAHVGDTPVDWLATADALAFFGGRDGYKRYINRHGATIIRRKLEEQALPPYRHPFRPMREETDTVEQRYGERLECPSTRRESCGGHTAGVSRPRPAGRIGSST